MSSDHPSPTLRLVTTPLDGLWRLCLAPRTTAILALITAFLIALGLALPQVPHSLAADPGGLARWLGGLEVQRGAWLGWAARVGLLSIYSSTGFRLMWAMLGLVALVTTADGVLAWHERRGRHPFPWHLLAYVGLLVLLGGALMEERVGWEQERLLVGDRPVAIGPAGQGLVLQRPATAKDALWSEVPVLWRQGAAHGEARLRNGRPLVIFPLTLHLQHAGPAARVRAADSSGQVITLDDPAAGGRLEAEVTLRFRQPGESHYLGIPARDWVLRVAYQPSSLGGSPFALWVYQGLNALPLAQAALTDNGTLTVGEIHLFWQVLPYAELRAALHPGLGLWAVGWLLLLAGLGASLAGRWPGAGTLAWIWAPAGLALGGAIWLVGGGPRLAANPLAAGSLLVLACGAAFLLLGLSAGLLAALGCETPALQNWSYALGWGALVWTAGGGLAVVAQWLSQGTLWRWEPQQAWWGLTGCLLLGAWRARTGDGPWARLSWLGVTTALAVWVALAGPRLMLAGL